MKIEMGESLFYSWLRHAKGCHIVQNNWKASPRWELRHVEELQTIMSVTDAYFNEHYRYRIYKNTSSLDQLIRQAECDTVGISNQEGSLKLYAVDVTFHESGLNYGTKDQTVMKIIAKSLRTAMCLYGYFDSKSAEIIFASPKIGNATLSAVIPCVEDANKLLMDLGYDFTIRIISNAEFNTAILQPILLMSKDIADTSELFMRSYQMVSMFRDQETDSIQDSMAATDEIPVGLLARNVLRSMLESGAATPEEIVTYQSLEGSKKVFRLSFPLLVPLDGGFQHERYYVEPLTIRGKQYRMTSQWREKTSKTLLQNWIQEHTKQ